MPIAGSSPHQAETAGGRSPVGSAAKRCPGGLDKSFDPKRILPARSRFHVRVPASSANLGPGYDSFGLALACGLACAGLLEQGVAIAEAYAKPDATSTTENHHGPLSMYLGAGFAVHRKDGDGVYVRKALR